MTDEENEVVTMTLGELRDLMNVVGRDALSVVDDVLARLHPNVSRPIADAIIEGLREKELTAD